MNMSGRRPAAFQNQPAARASSLTSEFPCGAFQINYRSCSGQIAHVRTYEAEPPGDHVPAGGSVGLFDQMPDAIESLERLRLLGLSPAPAWAEVWHRWHGSKRPLVWRST
jgi:hypothetical protein